MWDLIKYWEIMKQFSNEEIQMKNLFVNIFLTVFLKPHYGF